MIYDAIDIANKIVANTDTDRGETISNLKLQKLLYYVQGFNIAVFGEKLFKEPIVAWMYGPVVETVYNHFKTFVSGSINLDPNCKVVTLQKAQEELFNEVMKEYGQFSAIKLMEMTHEELPWKSVFHITPRGEIKYELLEQYFKTQIE